ncbi:hypothetical protein C8Q80DRAFT_514028 [Daedaleopsis nitida]|nr:hypothetical protein C8Q80DRAFT_514028 [Daedaleopsis nitida]
MSVLTATNRALLCQEIVDNVFDSLDSPYDSTDSSTRKTLASLATTCKNFSEPALRVLWRKLPSICYLLRLLPQWGPNAAHDKYYYTENTYTLHGEPNDEEWALLQRYAKLVRDVKWDADVEGTSIAQIVSKRCNGTHFLPRLEGLYSFTLSSEVFGPQCFFDALLPPTLRHLTLSFAFSSIFDNGAAPLLKHAVTRISTRLPLLTTLSVKECSSDVPMTMLHPLLALKTLRTVIITKPPMDNAILSHLAALESLKVLKASLSLDISDERRPNLDAGFSRAEIMKLRGNPQHISFVISAASMTKLRSLSLTITYDRRRGPVVNANSESLVQAVASIASNTPSSLTCFKLKVEDELPELPDLMVIIEPLLALRSLTELHLSFNQLLSVCDDELIRILTSMPDLMMLRIPHHKPYQSTDLPDEVIMASVLEFIALHCPRLHTLELPHLHFGDIPPLDGVFATHHRLMRLAFFAYPDRGIADDDEDDYPITLWLDAALYVNRLFPSFKLDAPEDDTAARPFGMDTEMSHRISGVGGQRLVHYLTYIRDGASNGEQFAEMGIDGVVDGAAATLPPLAI